MKETFKENLIAYIKACVPFLSSVIWLLLMMMPLHVPLFQMIKPDVVLACIYFWILCFDHSMGVISVVLLGLLCDMFSNVVLGTHMAVFIVVYVATKGYALWFNAKPFIVNWLGFALICVGALMMKWAILSIYHRHLLPILYIAINCVSTVLLYPLIAKVNLWVYNRYLLDDEAIHEQG